MKRCQVCGVCSWGPVKTGMFMASLVEIVGSCLREDYVQCDNCQTLAKREYLEETASAGGPIDPFSRPPLESALLSGFRTIIPEPPPLSEKLMLALINNAGLNIANSQPVVLARFVCALETALLEAQAPKNLMDDEVAKPWLAVRFEDRTALVTWLQAGLQTVRDSGVIFDPPSMASQFADWIEERE